MEGVRAEMNNGKCFSPLLACFLLITKIIFFVDFYFLQYQTPKKNEKKYFLKSVFHKKNNKELVKQRF